MIKVFKVVFLTVLVFVLTKNVVAQDYEWWNVKHNWDGSTPWFRMMTVSADNFGPNALPVLESNEAKIVNGLQFEFRPEFHSMKGDKTYDLFTSLRFPIAKMASFEAFIVPLEYYKMDTIVRDERLARNKNAEGLCGGDFWFGTNIKLIDEKKFPDLLASFYFKTASGTNLDDARYSDAPAYSIFLSFGKNIFSKQEEQSNLRLFGSIGTYIWQTHSDINSQDDAMSYSFGLSYSKRQFSSKLEIAGYHGYINNGDRPAVLRLNVSKNLSNWFRFGFRFQQGLTDFSYTSIGVSGVFLIDKWKLE